MEVKKIEVIFSKGYLAEITEILQKTGVSGYTILEVYNSYGKSHGSSLDFGFSSSQQNLYLFSICQEEEANNIIEKITPFVRQIGGMIISSKISSH